MFTKGAFDQLKSKASALAQSAVAEVSSLVKPDTPSRDGSSTAGISSPNQGNDEELSLEELRSFVLRLKRALKRNKDENSLLRTERKELLQFLLDTGILRAPTIIADSDESVILPVSSEEQEESNNNSSSSSSNTSATNEVTTPTKILTTTTDPLLSFAIGSLYHPYLRAEWASFLRRIGHNQDAQRVEELLDQPATPIIPTVIINGSSDSSSSSSSSSSSIVLSTHAYETMQAELESTRSALLKAREENSTIVTRAKSVIEKFKVLQAEHSALLARTNSSTVENSTTSTSSVPTTDSTALSSPSQIFNQDELIQLRQQNLTLQNDIEALRKENTVLTNNVKQQNQTVDTTTEKLKTLETSLASAQKQLLNLRTDSTAEQHSLRNQSVLVQQSIHNLQKLINDLPVEGSSTVPDTTVVDSFTVPQKRTYTGFTESLHKVAETKDLQSISTAITGISQWIIQAYHNHHHTGTVTNEELQKLREDYTAQIHGKNTEIQSLQDLLTSAQQTHRGLQEQVNSYESRIKELMDQHNQELRKHTEHLVNQSQASYAAQLQQEHTKWEQEQQRLLSHINTEHAKELDHTKTQLLEQFGKEKDSLQSQYSQQQQESTVVTQLLKEKLTALQTLHEDQQHQLTARNEKMQQLENTIKSLSSNNTSEIQSFVNEIYTLQAQITYKNEELQKLRTEGTNVIEGLQSQVVELTASSTEKDTQLSDIQAQLMAAQARLMEAEVKETLHSETTRDLEKRIHILDEEKRSLYTQINELKSTQLSSLSSTEEQVKVLSEQLHSTQQQLNIANEQLVETLATFATTKATNEELQRIVETMKLTAKATDTEYATVKQNYEAQSKVLHDKEEQYQNDIRSLTVQINTLKEQIQSTTEHATNEQTEQIVSLTKDKEFLQQCIDELQQKHEQLTKEKEAVQSTNDIYREQLRHYEETHETVRLEHEKSLEQVKTDTLTKQNDELTQFQRTSAIRLAEAESTIESLKSEIHLLSTQISVAQQDRSATQESLDEHRAKCASLEERITQLSVREQNWITDKQRFESEITEARRQAEDIVKSTSLQTDEAVQALTKQIQSKDTECKDMRDTLAEMQSVVTHLQGRLTLANERENVHQQHEQELIRCRNELEAVNEQLTTTREQHATLEIELFHVKEAMNTTVSNAASEATAALTRIESDRHAAITKANELTELVEQERTKAKQAIQRLATTATEMEALRNRTQNDILIMQQELTAVCEQATFSSERVKELEKMDTELRKRCETIEIEKSRFESEKVFLQETINQLRNELSTVTTRAETSERRLLFARNEAREVVEAEHSADMEAKLTALTRAHADLEARNAEIARLSARADALAAAVSTSNEQAEQRAKEASAARNQVVALETALSEAQTEAARNATAASTALNTLKERETTLNSLRSRLAEVEDTMRTVVDAHTSAGESSSRLNSELIVLRTEIRTLQSTVTEKDTEIERLKNELEKTETARTRTMEKAKAKLREQRDAHTAELDQQRETMEQRIQHAIQEKENSVSMLKTIQLRITDIEAQAALSAADAARHAESLSRRNSELEALVEEIRATARDAGRNSAKTLNAVLIEADNALRALGERETELRTLKAGAASASANLIAERDSLQRRLRSLQTALDEERARVSSIEQAAAAAAEAKLSSKLINLQEMRDTDKSIIEQIRRDAGSIVEKLRKDLRQQEVATEEAITKMNAAINIRTSLQNQIRTLQSQVREAQGQVEAGKAQIQQLMVQLMHIHSGNQNNATSGLIFPTGLLPGSNGPNGNSGNNSIHPLSNTNFSSSSGISSPSSSSSHSYHQSNPPLTGPLTGMSSPPHYGARSMAVIPSSSTLSTTNITSASTVSSSLSDMVSSIFR